MAGERHGPGGGHMCAGCPFAMTDHSGCVVGSNVVVYEGKVQVYARPKQVNVDSPAEAAFVNTSPSDSSEVF